MPIEAHAFALKEIALHGCAESIAMRAPPRRPDHALPWHRVQVRATQRRERGPDGARRARLPEDRRHLPVGDDLPARHAGDDAIDETPERRYRVASGLLHARSVAS